ncbi:endonuclease/exonuclease/phosphatase family protein [Fulvivirgaceae bacterium BMA12]|uniref:Endonuclease/exonuclease/phosphatase family protein n=1 Tax=Agaribacillus aureus TaxID=3051825 RepID=A0ABT8LBI2_9BACT|nr:endonuclease/exonuclease/phosphatase family protein [Fulvivirgaceae bacterium BMA12]
MKLRVATFNLENLDDIVDQSPSLAERIKVLAPQLERLRADILCFQEVHGQEQQNEKRQLLALQSLLNATSYATYHVRHVKTSNDEAYDQRNLVVVSRFPITEVEQYHHDLTPAPAYQKVTAIPDETEAKPVKWERPILYTKIAVREGFELHLINLHLKSRIPSNISGQKINNYTWREAYAWAEGFFISSMKRVGQALEARVLVDRLFDADAAAKIIVCGDFNGHPDEVPVEAIRGRVENTGNPDLIHREMVPAENTIPDSARYTYLYNGRKRLLDHMLISKTLIPYYRNAEIHNEVLHDETIAFALDTKFPESDHAPFVVEFEI